METLTVAEVERPDIKPWMWLLRRLANFYGRKHRDVIESDDLMQELAIWWYTVTPERLASYVEEEHQPRLRKSLQRVVWATVEKHTRQINGRKRERQVRYQPRQVMDLIPIALDPHGLPDGGGVQDDGPKAHGNVAEGGDILASLIDVRRALDRISDEDMDALLILDELAWDFDRAAPVFGIEADSARRKIARIAERMANWLNDEDMDDDDE